MKTSRKSHKLIVHCTRMDMEVGHMGPARGENVYGNFQPSSSAEGQRSHDNHYRSHLLEQAALEKCRMLLERVRTDLAERKRTGSPRGLVHLKFDAFKLSAEIDRLENLLIEK